jgi:hypothetical protein
MGWSKPKFSQLLNPDCEFLNTGGLSARCSVGVGGKFPGMRRRCQRCLFRAALAGDEDTDAFDHLSRRASALGKKDVGVNGPVEGVDRTGYDHGGETGVKLFRAADELVAVHLRHDEITEDEIDGARERSLDYLQCLMRGVGRNNTVTTGFQEEGADRECLFVVVNAEDRLLGAHAVSVLPDATLWWLAADGPD